MAGPLQAAATRMVGRTAELAGLRERLAELRATGTGCLVLVSGEAGVGKSRLVREFAAGAERSGVSVLIGRAVPDGEPYRPLVEAFGGALRDRGLPDDETLQPYLPVLAAMLPDAAVPGGRADARGGAVLGEAVLRLLGALAHRSAGAGTLLVLEDLHWVDPDTLTVLTYLAHAAESSPLMLVVTSRAEVAPPEPLLDLVTATNPVPVTLEAAGRRRSPRAGRGVPGRPAARGGRRRSSGHNADGLPLLIEELLTGLRSVGALDQAGRLVGPLTPGVPRTFAATVRRRVEDLDPAARSVLRGRAVLGRRFDWRLLPEVTGLAEAEVMAALRAGVRSGLIRAGEGDTFEFRHALTGEAIRDDLLPPERRALAHAAAEIVERRDPEAYALAAGLRAAAGENERAAELSVAAGTEAARQGALASADLLLCRAADLATAPELVTRAERELLTVLVLKGDAERSLALGERLLRDGDESVRLVLAEVGAEAERWDVAAAYLSAIPDDGDPRLSVLVARLAYARGEPERARDIALTTLRAAQERELWPVACQALEVIGRVARIDDAAGPGTRSRPPRRSPASTTCRPAGSPRCTSSAPSTCSRTARPHGWSGPGSWPRRPACSARPRRSTCRSPPGCCTATRPAGWSTPAAAPTWPAGCAPTACTRPRSASRPSPHRARRARAGRAVHRPGPHAGPGRPRHQRRGLGPDPGARRAARRRPAPAAGKPGQGRRLPAAQPEHRRDADPRPVGAGPHAVRAGRRRGQGGGQALVGELGERVLLGYAEAVACGRRSRHREADRELARGRPGDGRAALVAAPGPAAGRRLRAQRPLGRPGRLGPGGAAGLRRPRRDQAGQPLPRGAAAGRRPGAPAWPRRHPVPSALRAVGVTSREVDVLQLMGEGLTNTAIAQRLVLSPRTIETHVANLVAKTGASNRAGLVALARARIKSGPDGA
jgi:DNA-binding CsgD family transcriptional regulator